ncbi:MAG: xanthine dehydrogenase family protein subunit M [Candidatus Rokubacteria bacterium]|nr:xanthine dehydrogenase family protein subunit M [Candidatus Rokubacteria bacterium]
MIPFEYHAPATVGDAVAMLAARDGAKLLAGGQSLVPALTYRLARPGVLVDINALPLADVVRTNGHVRLGALVRHHVLEESPDVRRWCPLLAEAVAYVGNARVRTLGTLGGSLAHADPAAELPVAMVALDARFAAVGAAGSREIPAGEFFRAPLTTALAADEILTAVDVPVTRGAGTAFVELARRPGDFPLVSVAAVVAVDRAGRVADARVVFGGLAGAPQRSAPAEDALRGHEPTPERIAAAAHAARRALRPETDVFASGAYRAHLAEVLARRALRTATNRALTVEVR